MEAGVPILLYHDVADEGPAETALYRVGVAAFRQQMLFLRDRGFRSISLQEWATCIAAGRPPEGRCVVITFDDGFHNLTRNAVPALAEAGLQATVFVVTERVGAVADWDHLASAPPKLMDWDELQAWITQGHAVASHCRMHRDLTTLSDEEIAADSHEARAALKRKLDIDATAVAFPWGKSNPRVEQALAANGYSIGVGVTGGRSTLGDPLMHLPRIEVFGGDDLAMFALNLGVTPPAGPVAEALPAFPELNALARRVASVIDELQDIKTAFNELSAALVLEEQAPPRPLRTDPLYRKCLALFTLPELPTPRSLAPFETVVPGVRFGFPAEAQVRMSGVTPPADLVPADHKNALCFEMSGGSWSSIEVSIAPQEIATQRPSRSASSPWRAGGSPVSLRCDTRSRVVPRPTSNWAWFTSIPASTSMS